MPAIPAPSPPSALLAAVPFGDPLAKILFLSMMIAIIAIPTRLSRGNMVGGPKRVVTYYFAFCGLYYFLLRFVVARL